MAALPATHPLAKHKQLLLKSLAAESFILHPRSEGPVLYDRFLVLCKEAGFSPHIVYKEAKHQTRIALVAAGTGITIVPSSLQRAGLADIVYCTLAGEPLQLQLAIAWQKHKPSPVVHQFVQIIQQVMPQSVERKMSAVPVGDIRMPEIENSRQYFIYRLDSAGKIF